MGDLRKVVVRKDFWYEGRHYMNGECLFLPFEVLEKIGLKHFTIIKALEKPFADKMMRTSVQK